MRGVHPPSTTWLTYLSVLPPRWPWRFNPILFQEKYNLSPATLTWLVLAAQILSVFAPTLCGQVAACIGRAKTMVFVRMLEPACLLGMVFSGGGGVYVAGGCFVVLLGVPIGTRAIEKARHSYISWGRCDEGCSSTIDYHHM